jgi:hypothetical protein
MVMFREKPGLNEVRVSHELSGRINTRRNDRPAGIERETRSGCIMEVKYAG